MDSVEAAELLNHMYQLYIRNAISYRDFEFFFQDLPLNVDLFASIQILNNGLQNTARITFSHEETLYGIEFLDLQIPEDFDYLMDILRQRSYTYPIPTDTDIYQLSLA